jgi:hypothetical protein
MDIVSNDLPCGNDHLEDNFSRDEEPEEVESDGELEIEICTTPFDADQQFPMKPGESQPYWFGRGYWPEKRELCGSFACVWSLYSVRFLMRSFTARTFRLNGVVPLASFVRLSLRGRDYEVSVRLLAAPWFIHVFNVGRLKPKAIAW